MPSKYEQKTLAQRFIYFFTHMGLALGYSCRGLATGCRLSLSFRQEAMVLVVLCVLLGGLGKPAAMWLLCLGAWAAVMVIELVNTALEETLDLITRDYSIHVRDAKDMASGAVLLLLVCNACLWLYVFWEDIRTLFGQQFFLH